MKKKILAVLTRIIEKLAIKTIERFKPFVIAITGSVGKTSAKEAIYAIVRDTRRVRRTSANLNNELGVPLTVLGDYTKVSNPAWLFWIGVIIKSGIKILIGRRSSYPEILILEYGADAPGDIKKLVSVIKPDVGVLTAIGTVPVHVENYPGGIEDVIKEKKTIISALSSSHTAIVNADDPHIQSITEKAKAHIYTYGFSQKSDFIISHSAVQTDDRTITGITCKIENKGSAVPCHIKGVFSIAHTYAVACACAVGMEVFHMNMVDILSAFEKYYQPVSGRSLIVPGVKKTTIIDESYNSSPLALETALRTMERTQLGKRKIGILGDMLELGQYTVEAHQQAGAHVARALDGLIAVGVRARLIAHAARAHGMKEEMIVMCDSAEDAKKEIKKMMRIGDIILIKGSHSIGLEAVVEEIRDVSVIK